MAPEILKASIQGAVDHTQQQLFLASQPDVRELAGQLLTSSCGAGQQLSCGPVHVSSAPASVRNFKARLAEDDDFTSANGGGLPPCARYLSM